MRHVIYCVVALALSAGAALAQENSTEIRGRALDAQDAVLPGVTITATNQATGIFREAVTNADGTYFIPALTPGQYEIAAALSGFKRHAQRDVRLDLGRTTTLERFEF